MIQQLSLLSKFKNEILEPKVQENKVVIDCNKIVQDTNSFTIEITFNSKIVAFRNHDYTWHDLKVDTIATEYSPKILQLENGFYVQSNINQGIWEVNKKDRNKLSWHFNPHYSKPLTQYVGRSNAKKGIDANSVLRFIEQPTLLFFKKNPIEISRSLLPFSAITCFTDHCDFDTLENLKIQRAFFKEKKIKITKGFFLNHFSKRHENASYENDAIEIESWKNDGHELCYHSLSQSIKSNEDSFSNFQNFIPPFQDIPVWIDHGYQPYNLSLFENCNFDTADYESNLKKKNIKILWNYIDSGTATTGVINQLNKNHFTLHSFLKGNKSLPTIKLLQAMIKNIVFHYLNDDKTIAKYKSTAQNFKKIAYQKQFKIIPKFIKDFTVLFTSIASVLFLWNTNKNKAFKLSKYTPLFFKNTILKEEFVVFQTLEMIDFSKALSKENINLLIKESGIFLAHTYFSDSIVYHNGKLLTEKNLINTKVDKNFNYLSNVILENKIWNPTLSELYAYLSQFESLLFDIDSDNNLIVKNSGYLIFRTIN